MAGSLQTMRLIALFECTIGFLMIIFGIVDRVEVRFWTSYVTFPIWIGVWVGITGIIGCLASSRRRTSVNYPLVGVYLGFSITATVMAAVILVCYSIVLSMNSYYPNRYYNYDDYDGDYYYHSDYDTRMAISAIVLILGILQFFLGIWSSVCCCQAFGCDCCVTGGVPQNEPGQAMYVTNQGAPLATYVVAQNPGGNMAGQVFGVPSPGGPMMAMPVQVPTSGGPLMAIPHVGSPVVAVQVPSSRAPVMAVPVQTVPASSVALPVGAMQYQDQGIRDTSATGDHVGM